MNNKFLNPEYKRMYQVLKARLVGNLGKTFFIILLFNILISFLVTTGIYPAVILGNAKIGKLISFVFSFAIFIVIWTLFYGMILYFTNIILGKSYSINMLLAGFKEKSKRILY